MEGSQAGDLPVEDEGAERRDVVAVGLEMEAVQDVVEGSVVPDLEVVELSAGPDRDAAVAAECGLAEGEVLPGGFPCMVEPSMCDLSVVVEPATVGLERGALTADPGAAEGGAALLDDLLCVDQAVEAEVTVDEGRELSDGRVVDGFGVRCGPSHRKELWKKWKRKKVVLPELDAVLDRQRVRSKGVGVQGSGVCSGHFAVLNDLDMDCA